MEEEGVEMWASELGSEDVQIPDELLENFSTVFTFLEEIVRVIHQNTLVGCMQAQAPHKHHPMHNSTFLCSTLPKFVHWILKSRLVEHDLDIANQFLSQVIILISYYLNYLHPQDTVTVGLLRLLSSILDDSQVHYKTAMRYQEKWEVLQRIAKNNRNSKSAAISSSVRDASYQFNELFVSTVTHFTNFNGLHGLLNVHSTMPLDLALLSEVMNVYQKFIPALSKASCMEFLVPLRNDAFKVLLGLKEEELRPLQNHEIDRYVETIHELEYQKEMGHTMPEAYAEFNLAFALKCFRSSLLPKRIHGLSCIDQVLRRNSSRNLVEWLNKHEILLDLFGRDTHPELIRRSKDTLVFLAKENGLNSELLDLIWSKATNQATNKESTQEAEVIRVLSSIIDKFPAKLASDLVTRTCRLPYSNFSPKLIELIARQASHEVMGQQQLENLHGGYQAMRLVVINLLLDFIRDENTSQVSHQCFDVAQRQLLGLMKSLSERSISFCSLVVEIIQICVDRIRNGTELIQSMALIRKASAYFTNNTYLDQDRFVSELLVGHKLIELTINAFKAYKFAAKVHFESKAIPVESPRNQAQVDPNKIVTGKNMFATHGEYLSYFRDFLTLLFDLNWQIFSQFPIPVKMVGKLWQCAMKYSLGEVERDEDIKWLTTQCKKTAFCHYYERRRRYDRYLEDYNLTLQIEAMKYLLDCFGRLDPTVVTAPQFGCFKDCFIFVNRKLKRLRKSRHNLMAIDVELEGFQTLWEIVLHGKNEEVFNSALRFLVSLYIHTSLPESNIPDSDGSDEDEARKSVVEEIRVEFMHRSMEQIDVALKASSGVLAQRCVSVLGSFLDSVPRYGGSVPLQGFSEDDSFGVGDIKEGKKVANSRDSILDLERDPFHHIPSPSSQTEREAVVNLLGIFGGENEMLYIVALHNNSWSECEAANDLLNEDRKNQFLEIAQRYETERERITQQQEAIRKASLSGPVHPALCLSHHQTYFERLFQLLDVDGVNTDDVWKMIDSLPTNPQMLRQFSEIPTSKSPIDWPSLFHTESPYRFLYALKIVGSFLGKGAGEQACAPEGMLLWRDFFVQSGGFSYLLSLLVGENAKQLTGHREWKRCLSQLMRIIFGFVCVESEKDEDLSSAAEEFRESMQQVPSLFQQDHKVDGALINSVDFGGVMPNLVGLLWDCARASKEEPRFFEYNEDALMHGLCFLVLSLFSDKSQESWALLRDFPKIDEFFLDLLLRSEHRGTRVMGKEAVEMLCRLASGEDCPLNQEAGKGPYSFFLNLLMLSVPALFENRADYADTEQFFELLNSLLPGSQGNEIDFTEFVQQILFYLQQREIVERGEYDPPDTLFNGLVSVVLTIVSRNQRLREVVNRQSFSLRDGSKSDVFEFLFECLFCGSPNPSKNLSEREIASWMEVSLTKMRCKHQTSRALIFELLTSLVQGDKNGCLRALVLLSESLKGSEQRILPACFARPLNSMSRSITGFVGMQNLGCTCYINSVLQQIFLIPYVRNRILCARASYLEEEGENSEEKEVVPKTDILLSELQRLFAFLAKSTTQYYDMNSFCQRTNVNAANQEDAHEYLNSLFDKLEASEKGDRVSDFLSLFRTKTGIETVCQNPSCDYRGDLPQDSYMLSINVQGQSNLESALEAFATPEEINDFRCDKCKEKKGCARRPSIRNLPPCLIVHLNRFDIDYETFTTRKLLHHFVFPMEINLKNYTLEGLSPLQKSKVEETREKAGGLSEASGSTGSGSSEPPEQSDSNRSHLSSSGSSLASGSGGENVASGGLGGFEEKGKEKAEAAAVVSEVDAEETQDNKYLYRLRGCVVHSGTAEGGHYYSFIRGDPVSWFRFDDTNVSSFDVSDLGDECFGGEQGSAFDSWAKKEPKPMTAYMLFYERVEGAEVMFEREKELPDLASVPQQMLDDISTQNMDAYKEKQRFEEPFMSFMLSLVSSVSSMPSPDPSLKSQALSVGTYYWMEIISRTDDEDLFQRWLVALVSLYENDVPQCEWLLDLLVKRHSNYLRYMLLECNNKNIREHFQRFLETILRYLSEKDAHRLYEYHCHLEEGRGGEKEEEEEEEGNDDSLPYIQDVHPSVLYGNDQVLNDSCKSAMLMNHLIDILESTRNNWPTFSNYFTLWLRFSLMTRWHAVYMIHRRVVFFLVDYLLGSKSPAFRNSNRMPIRDMQTGRTPKMYSFLKLLALLVTHAHTEYSIQHKQEGLIKLDNSTYRLLHSDLFLTHLIYHHEERHSSVSEICRYLICGDPSKTERLFSVLLRNMLEADEFSFSLLRHLLERLLLPSKTDNIDRPAILMNPTNGMFVSVTRTPLTRATVFRFFNLFLDLAHHNEQFAQVMIENRQEYSEWIYTYLLKCDHVPMFHDRARILHHKFLHFWEEEKSEGDEYDEEDDEINHQSFYQ